VTDDQHRAPREHDQRDRARREGRFGLHGPRGAQDDDPQRDHERRGDRERERAAYEPPRGSGVSTSVA